MVLEKINEVNDIKNLSWEELEVLSEEIREFLIEKISVTGGHLAPNLGVVELTMIINNSQYMGDATLDSAYRLVKNGTADDEAREELAKMMRSLR